MNFLKTAEGKNFIEHHDWYYNESIPEVELPEIPDPILFHQRKESICVQINKDDRILRTSYFVGTDWLNSEKAIYIEPKLNKDSDAQTNYLQMLFSILRHPDIVDYASGLFEIKLENKQIEIEQKQDLITPLLVVQFLAIVQRIVRKGLKKSYYKVEKNLHCRVKGKILISQTIKKNLLQGKALKTICSYDEFGFNCLENRLIKIALIFVQRYLPTLKHLKAEGYTTKLFNYINPAFAGVTDEVNHFEVVSTKTNVFYKEYNEAIHLAKLIMQRFGFNITNVQESRIVKTPPFWIDMSKLFELYVLGQLKDIYGNEVKYHPRGNYGETDFLLISDSEKYIIDAKYKTKYIKEEYKIEDIRQLAGYSRDTNVLKKMGIEEAAYKTIVPACLIIHPDQSIEKSLSRPIETSKITQFANFYKCGIKLPEI